MDHPSGCFARLGARELPIIHSPANRPATKVSCNRVLRPIEEGRQRRRLRQASQTFPLGDEKISGRRIANQRHECEHRVLVPRSIPMEKRAPAIV